MERPAAAVQAWSSKSGLSHSGGVAPRASKRVSQSRKEARASEWRASSQAGMMSAAGLRETVQSEASNLSCEIQASMRVPPQAVEMSPMGMSRSSWSCRPKK